MQMHIAADESLWTVGEVANHLNVSTQAVYTWVKTGKMAYVAIGRNRDKFVIPESEVKRMEEERTKEYEHAA